LKQGLGVALGGRAGGEGGVCTGGRGSNGRLERAT